MRKKHLSRWLLLVLAVMAVVLVAAACAREEEEAGPAAPKGTIRLAENDWTGNFIDIWLAKIILEEEMGYDVELIFADYTAQWVAVSAGDLDVAMEVWPSFSFPPMEEYLSNYGGNGLVTDLGPIGVVGTTGMYIFDYMLYGDPERGIEPTTPDLVDWTDLNQYKDLFVAPETAPNGRWVGAPVVGWQAHDEERIANLGLDYQHVYLGSDIALIAEIEAYYTRGEPLLFYMWEPHWIQAKYDVTEVILPAYSDECFGLVEGIEPTFACDFPNDVLFNIANTQWVEENPEAAQFFTNFDLTNEHQSAMILAIDAEGVPVEQAVRQWMAENEDLWRAWIPTGY